jgi:hypothetical protein
MLKQGASEQQILVAFETLIRKKLADPQTQEV